MYKRYELYRATGVVLMDLVQDTQIQYSLFEDPLKAEKIRELYEAVDALSGKYGKHTLHLGASHPIEVRGKGRRGAPTVREQTQLYGETRRKHLGLPLFQAESKSPAHPIKSPCKSPRPAITPSTPQMIWAKPPLTMPPMAIPTTPGLPT